MIPIVTPEEMGAIDAAAPEPVEVLIGPPVAERGQTAAVVVQARTCVSRYAAGRF